MSEIAVARRSSTHRRASGKTAIETIKDVDASGLWPSPVVTVLAPARNFWESVAEHQDYLQRYPNGYTCHFVRHN
jgi:peptide-methionine (S)-S-oxide reductase